MNQIIFYLIFPDTFLLPSHPEMYFNNYFNPGVLYSIQDSFFFIVILYILFHMLSAYHKADYKMRNKLKYFILSFLYK